MWVPHPCHPQQPTTRVEQCEREPFRDLVFPNRNTLVTSVTPQPLEPALSRVPQVRVLQLDANLGSLHPASVEKGCALRRARTGVKV